MRFEDLRQYDYELPPELIRKKGVEPRDAARLFVYDTKTDTIHHDFVYNLAKYLPERSLMVLNETRVVPARLWLKKETGGKIEIFVLANEWDGETEIPVLVDRKTLIGQKIFFPDGSFFEVTGQEKNKFFVSLKSERTLRELLDRFGETPLPHYLENTENESPLTPARSATALQARLEDSGAPLDEGSGKRKESVFLAKEWELRRRYQTVFAKTGASVAAPTASLHFTDRVFASLSENGVAIAKVTLDVGLGTFAPLCEENFTARRLHRERIDVSPETADALNEAKRTDRKIVAVGTTALRTLESIFGHETWFRSFSGSTDIFIFPPHEFRSADILMTNFHLPETSLMLLVDAFLAHKGAKQGIMPLYEEAIRDRYAFYSFGDSMLIL